MQKLTRPKKESHILEKIRQAVGDGRYRDTRHSSQRGFERGIVLGDVIEVLATGHHEASKDEYRLDFQSWSYAIRGRTIDGDELRIVIYFEDDLVMIATVIRL